MAAERGARLLEWKPVDADGLGDGAGFASKATLLTFRICRDLQPDGSSPLCLHVDHPRGSAVTTIKSLEDGKRLAEKVLAAISERAESCIEEHAFGGAP